MMRIPLLLGESTRDELVAELRSQGVRTNAYFDALLPHVVVAPSPRPLTIAIGCPEELGFPAGTTLDGLIAHVGHQGLAPCPLEAALRLRLALTDQPAGARLTVVSRRVVDDETFPRGFYLRRDDQGLWLRAFVASDDWSFDGSELLALAVRGDTGS
jgi:hypothetical protein